MTMRGLTTRAFLAWLSVASCNFDAAFNRYCSGNSRCQADAGSAPEAGPETGPEAARPEAAPEAGPEAGPETGQGNDVGDADPWRPISFPKNCSASGGCSAPDEICNPREQVCMKTCNSQIDCPPWLDLCIDPRFSSMRGPKVCSCTASSCNKYASGYTCNPLNGQCERICTTDQDCSSFQPARTCEQVSGLCQPIPQTCSSNSDCHLPDHPRCDPVALVCSGCLSASDCTGRSDGFSQCSPSGGCVNSQP